MSAGPRAMREYRGVDAAMFRDTIAPRYDDLAKFVAMMRTGKRPDGSEVSKVMPFATTRNLNDVDLAAMYAFLKTLPPREAGGH